MILNSSRRRNPTNRRNYTYNKNKKSKFYLENRVLVSDVVGTPQLEMVKLY